MPAVDITRMQKINELLGYMSEEEFMLFAGATPNTVEAWRKRREGPSWVRIGNRVYYPLDGVGAFMTSRTHVQKLSNKDLL